MPTPGGSPIVEHGGFYLNADVSVAIASNVGVLDEDDDNITELPSRHCKVEPSTGRAYLGRGRWLCEFNGNLLATTNTVSAQFRKNGTAEGAEVTKPSVATIGVPVNVKHIVEITDNGQYVDVQIGNDTGATTAVVVKGGAYVLFTCLESYSGSRQRKNA